MDGMHHESEDDEDDEDDEERFDVVEQRDLRPVRGPARRFG